jgi:hypothetical protein
MVERAFAYLKAELAPGEGGPPVELREDDEPVLRPLGNRLLVAYLVDEGSHFRYVDQRAVRAAGCTLDELHAKAIGNLVARFGGGLRVVQVGAAYAVLADGNIEASLLLVDGLWDGPFRQFVAGEYAAVVPARDVLVFGDAASPAAIADLEATVARLRAAPAVDHRLIDDVLVRVDGRWQRRVTAA